MPKPYHIAFAADANFSVPLALAIYSAQQHAGAGVEYCFHVLDGGVNRELLAPLRGDIRYYEMGKQLEHLPICGRFPTPAYYRFLLPELLPLEIERVLYLDVDIMVCQDLTPLWNIPMQGKILAAAPWEILSNYRAEYGPQLDSFCNRFNLSDDGESYFYSSMLLMDLVQMRQENTCQQLISFAEKTPTENLIWPDQDVINAVLRGRIARLPLHCNVIPIFEDGIEQESDEAQAAFRNPSIIHYAATKPNVLTGPRDTYEKRFFAFWQNSPWANKVPYPLVSLRCLPTLLRGLLMLPIRLGIRCPRFLKCYGKLLQMLRGAQ